MKIWTATTDGDNCELTTTVHSDQDGAARRVLGDMGIPFALAAVDLRTDLGQIIATWEKRMDGACLIQEHEVAP